MLIMVFNLKFIIIIITITIKLNIINIAYPINLLVIIFIIEQVFSQIFYSH